MSALTFHRNHNQHIKLSEELADELQKSGQDVLQQIINVDKKTVDKMLIKVINGSIGTICAIIPALQEIVIKSNEKENIDDLKAVIKKLSQFSNEIIQEYDSDSNTLKQKFTEFVENILVCAEGLLNVIKKNELHDFKHELVETLKDMMFAIQRIQTRIQVENYKAQDIQNVIVDVLKDYVKDLSTIEKCSPDVLKAVALHSLYSAKRGTEIAYHLNKVASNYHDIEIQHKILESAMLVNTAASPFLLIEGRFADAEEAIKLLIEVDMKCWNSFAGLFQFMDKPQNNKNFENLNDIAKYVASYGIVIHTHTGKGINNLGLFYMPKKN